MFCTHTQCRTVFNLAFLQFALEDRDNGSFLQDDTHTPPPRLINLIFNLLPFSVFPLSTLRSGLLSHFHLSEAPESRFRTVASGGGTPFQMERAGTWESVNYWSVSVKLGKCDWRQGCTDPVSSSLIVVTGEAAGNPLWHFSVEKWSGHQYEDLLKLPLAKIENGLPSNALL